MPRGPARFPGWSHTSGFAQDTPEPAKSTSDVCHLPAQLQQHDRTGSSSALSWEQLKWYTVAVLQLLVKSLSRVQLFATPWTVAHQAPLSIFSRQEYYSGLPLLSPGDLPDTGIKPRSLILQADSVPSEPPGNPPSLVAKWCSVL